MARYYHKIKTSYIRIKMKIIITLIVLLSSVSFGKSSLSVDIYELDNGLTVILNPDKNASSVYGAVGIKGGGKQDPADARYCTLSRTYAL